MLGLSVHENCPQTDTLRYLVYLHKFRHTRSPWRTHGGVASGRLVYHLPLVKLSLYLKDVSGSGPVTTDLEHG